MRLITSENFLAPEHYDEVLRFFGTLPPDTALCSLDCSDPAGRHAVDLITRHTIRQLNENREFLFRYIEAMIDIGFFRKETPDFLRTALDDAPVYHSWTEDSSSWDCERLIACAYFLKRPDGFIAPPHVHVGEQLIDSFLYCPPFGEGTELHGTEFFGTKKDSRLTLADFSRSKNFLEPLPKVETTKYTPNSTATFFNTPFAIHGQRGFTAGTFRQLIIVDIRLPLRFVNRRGNPDDVPGRIDRFKNLFRRNIYKQLARSDDYRSRFPAPSP